MKNLLALCLFVISVTCFGQTSLQQLNLKPGKYAVGFKHYVATDSTRTYKIVYDWNNKSILRPIPVSIWYPAVTGKAEAQRLTILNYMEILKAEEEWEQLPNEQLLNWFSYTNTPENRAHLTEKTSAIRNIPPAAEKFPVIVYAASFQASSIENFALCEFLASNGYVVIASPSRGAETRFFEGGTDKDAEAQARDIEFLIKDANKYKYCDVKAIATMGFSFGGLSNVLAQVRNASVKAIVSLDGSVKYNYGTLQKSPFFKVEKVNVPFIHIAQKDIPQAVLAEDKIDSALNHKFEFYDQLVNSKAYSLRFHNLTHSYFSTLGVLFQERDKRQDKSDVEIMESYNWVAGYALQFLNAFIKNDKQALRFLENKPEENGFPSALITKKSKESKPARFTFEDFNTMAKSRQYTNLDTLLKDIQTKHPAFKAEEWKLNNLAFQLLFNPATTRQGISVFLFAVKTYPQSANLFDSLGEAYLFTGEKKLAAQNFRKSLALDPQNQNAVKRLAELK